MKLAYLVSQYPKVSHSFIRREILALERLGWQILRLSIRGWDATLVDPDDILERERTIFALRGGAPPLIKVILEQLFKSPRRFVRGFFLAVRMMESSDRPFVWHLIYLAEACWVAAQIRQSGLRHLHAHFGANDAEVAMLAAEMAGISFSFTVHGPEEFDRSRAIHLVEKVRRASFVVAISSFGRSQLLRILDQSDWHKINVVHCGVDRAFSEIAAVEPSENNRLVCVGRLCAQKGQLLLVKAMKKLVSEGRQFELILVGDGEHRSAIERLIVDNDLSSCVKLVGWASASQVKAEILEARAFILPSFAEGLPVALMEAMILGRPVLTTYIAGIPELVVDGKAGWLFPAGSEDELRDAVRGCLDSSTETLKAMGEFARKQALQRHDIDDQVAVLAKLFEGVVKC